MTSSIERPSTSADSGDQTIYGIARPGRRTTTFPPLDVPLTALPDARWLRTTLPLPEVAEIDLVRHYVNLSHKNHAIDVGFYPLGSCTMKYNPKRNEDAARLPGFASLHPRQPTSTVQGALELMAALQDELAEITGMDAVTLTPSAGAHGEFTGMMLIRAWHLGRGDSARTRVVVPASAHGTNPATAAMCGYSVTTLGADTDGNVDLDELAAALGPDVAGIMLTMPSTLGLFDPRILEITALVHAAGGLVYGDGANMNALLGQAKPGQLGFDVMHLNLHKTASTPHGGGGPGAGPVCVKASLAPFLPAPHVTRLSDGTWGMETPPHSIGAVSGFAGNFGILVRAYTYLRTLGAEGLAAASENAVINANYILAALKDDYRLAYDRHCMHEVVFAGLRERNGVKTLDVAKRLLDFGIHPPTVYFPLIVEEALMIEPTETESRETLDRFIEVMHRIAREARDEPDLVRNAPYTTPVGRLDEATAARKPILRHRNMA